MKRRDEHGPCAVANDDRLRRGRLWARALDSGCDIGTIADAYNVSTRTVSRGAMRYRKWVADGKS